MSNSATSNNPVPARIVLTPGEPAGIGPDLALALAQHSWDCAVIHVADPTLLAARADALKLQLRFELVVDANTAEPVPAGTMQILPVALEQPCTAGSIDLRNSHYVLRCLDRAVDLCRDHSGIAMVTGPVNKAAINDAGIAFSGHTEYLAERLHAPLPVMMLVAGDLRVALLTTHVALAQVPALVTGALINQVVEIVARDLERHFKLPESRLAICGLNPHAGEQGHLGREEIEVITPAVDSLNKAGIAITGPLPADTAFAHHERSQYDAIIALYHDQGLAPLKALSFGDAVNVTLGLPIVRTSVDHGTALDLAGTGKADTSSLRAALELAISLVAESPAVQGI